MKIKWFVNYSNYNFFVFIICTSVFSLFSNNSRCQSLSSQEIDSLHIAVSSMMKGSRSDSVLKITNYTLAESTKLDYDFGKARALVLAGSYLLIRTRLDTSEILLNKANEIYIDNKIFKDSIQSKYARLLQSLGVLNNYKRKYKVAKDYLSLALRLFKKEGDIKRYRNTLGSLGIMQGKQGNYAEALEYFLLALEGPKTQKYSIIMGNIALCYKNMGHVEKATKYLKEGLELDMKNNWPSMMYKLTTLATIHNELGQLDSAIFYAQKAINESKNNGRFNSTVVSMTNLVNYYIKKEQFNKAEMLIQETLKLADSVGITDVQEKFDQMKADIFFNKHNYDSTLFYARRAYKSTSQNSDKDYSQYLAYRLYSAFEKKGEYDSALHYVKEYYNYRDSLFNKKNQRKFTELFAKMDNLEKQSQIELLDKEKKVETLKKQRLSIISVGIILTTILLITVLVYKQKNRLKKQELKQARLQTEVEKGQQELYKQTLHMIHINNTLDSLEEIVKGAIAYNNSDSSYSDILKTIKINKSLEKDWENFNNYFSNIHSGFYKSLSSNETKLSNHEKRVCALIKLNLSNREIATILNIESKSVTMLKYRLKKKIGLSEQVDLGTYIHQLL